MNSKPLFLCCLLAVCGLMQEVIAAGQPAATSTDLGPPLTQADLPKARDYYLKDLHVLRDYLPGKNSFVEGPDRRWGAYREPGQKLTLLDLTGRGSVRHLWSTWADGKGNHRLRFTIDGTNASAWEGTLDELIARSRADQVSPIPITGFVGNRRARNLFTPIPFDRSLRLEMETIEPTWLIFYQLDYRLEREKPAFPPATPSTPAGETIRDTKTVLIPPNQNSSPMVFTGPGIIRKWSLKTDVAMDKHGELDLSVRFDQAAKAAVQANVADFYGPFAGAGLETDSASGLRASYFPMPFRERAEFVIASRLTEPVRVTVEAEIEKAAGWNDHSGYFHARGQITSRTVGYRQHQVLYTRGRGHWVGMVLYNTGHDHGGGDVAVIDGESDTPAFLKGINGEDYFTFAWFGRGDHHPFAIARANEEGRYRHHFENPYPFSKSFSLYWGVYPNLKTRSVAYWYQDSPENLTVEDAQNPLNVEWDCFGPVPLKLDEQFKPVGDFQAVLPDARELDAGKKFECRCINERFVSGWMKQTSIGPMLDLTYLSRHGTPIKGEIELGGMGHAYLARRKFTWPRSETVEFQVSHDDPIRILLNGRVVYEGGSQSGFRTKFFQASLEAGDNEWQVQLANFFNVNFNWAGFLLRPRD